MEQKKLISVVTPCYNEEENVEKVYRAIQGVFKQWPQYNYEHIFIDNSSKDKTISILRKLASQDKNLKIILNYKNFGQSRSPYHGFLQAGGAAVITFICDLQDPPELIHEFIKQWEKGEKVVIGIKSEKQKVTLLNFIKKIYYKIIALVSDGKQIRNFTGYGLYDRSFVEVVRQLNVINPYFRGLVADYAETRHDIIYDQPERKKGRSNNTLYTLYDYAMLGLVNHSRVPLRMASFLGFGMGFVSLLISIVYLVYKLIFWDEFQLGMAPVAIGLFFFASIQLFFIGILGEYVGVIYTEVRHHPLVIEKERVNFD